MKYNPMQLFKKAGLKYCLMLLMLVMVAQAQQSAGALYDAASKGDKAALAQLKALGNKGDTDAGVFLGSMFFNGTSVPKDSVQAASWLRKSANQGDALAQNNLALMYEYGVGVPRDLVIAYMWWNLAAAQGDEIAKKLRGLLEKIMTPAQIAEGQRLCREWKPKKP